MKQTLRSTWTALRPLMSPFRDIKKDERGVTAVEFALILPILLVTYMGTVEISQGLTVSRNTTNIASTVADLIGQTSEVDEDDIAMIFQASKTIISPFTSGNVQIIASSYCRQRSTVTPPPVGGKIPPNTTSTGIVRDWMQKFQATSSNDPSDLDQDGDVDEAPSMISSSDEAVISLLPFNEDSLIVAETQYHYDFISPASAVFKVLFGSSNKFGNAGANGRGSFTVRDRFFVRPRNARNVIREGVTICPN